MTIEIMLAIRAYSIAVVPARSPHR
jgi:hypothetical protein